MNKIYELEHQIEQKLKQEDGEEYFVLFSPTMPDEPFDIHILNTKNQNMSLTIYPNEAIWFITPDAPNVLCTGPILPSTKYLNVLQLCKRIRNQLN